MSLSTVDYYAQIILLTLASSIVIRPRSISRWIRRIFPFFESPVVRLRALRKLVKQKERLLKRLAPGPVMLALWQTDVVNAVNALEVSIHSHKSGWTMLPLAHLIFWTKRETEIRRRFRAVTAGLQRFCNEYMPSLISEEDNAVPGRVHNGVTMLAAVGHRSPGAEHPSVHERSHPHHDTVSKPGPMPARDESTTSEYVSYSSSRRSSSASGADAPGPFPAQVVATDPTSQNHDATSSSESSTRSRVSSLSTPEQTPSAATPAQTYAPQAGATGVTHTSHTHLSLSFSQHGANDPRSLLPLHTRHDTGPTRGPGAPWAG